MPVYEYQCSDCGSVTSELQKMSDAPLSDCPSCTTQGTLHKLMSAPAVGAASSVGGDPMPPGCGRCGDPQGSCVQ